MIGSFRHAGLEELYRTGGTRKIGREHVRKCVRVLQLMEAAERPEEMAVAGYRFHPLQGSPRRWSVRVSANYRITFGWQGEQAQHIDLEDYH